jgi:hypothetical protein|tara:strand:- start:773 stop:1021 length:249 start_codon:yes stop_codon:yes gene_type:complete
MKTLCFLVSFLFCIFAKGQHIYFDVTFENIDTVAKEDGYRVVKNLENSNIVCYLYSESDTIKIGYNSEMSKPSFIIYREEKE